MADPLETATPQSQIESDSDELGLDKLPPLPPSSSDTLSLGTMHWPKVDAETWPTLPGFEILGMLGRGGMGTVYRARELHLNRMVAVKMLISGELAHPDERARFLREAQMLAGLQHPNIVQVFQGGEAHGRLYLVMECVEGGALDRRLRGQPLTPETAAAVVEVLARTMAYVHGQGLLHRDLKLANVLVAGNPEGPLAAASMKITDFGLAKRFEADEGAAATHTIVGTPNYMAPEQASGQPATPASDVYGLGAILYVLLAGRPPFTGPTWMDTVQKLLTTDPVPPRRLDPKVPRDLETICLHCLQKEPARRYAGAMALADDLQRFLAGRPIQARPASLWDRAVKWTRRRPAVAGLLAALVTITLCGIGLVTWKWLEAEQANTDLVATQGQKLAAREALVREQLAHEAAQEEAKRARSRDHALTFADRAWWNNQPERCQEMLNFCPTDLRRWEWNFLRQRLQAGQTILHPDLFEIQHVAFSPDGKLLACGVGETNNSTHKNEIKIWSVSTRKLLFTLAGHQGPITWVCFHPKRNILVSLSTRIDWGEVIRGDPAALHQATGECIVWDLDTKEQLATIAGCFGHGDLSPDGAFLAVPGAGQIVGIWDASTPWPWKQIAKLPPYRGLIRQVAFHPDGKLLARAGVHTRGIEHGRIEVAAELKLWHVKTGEEERSIPTLPVEIGAMAFHPAGRILAWSNGAKTTATLWDLETNQPLRTLFGHQAAILGMAFHEQGKWLATAGTDRSIKLWDVATGENLHTLRGHTASVQHVAFAPDRAGLARCLASAGADSTVRLWDPIEGQDPPTLRGHDLAVTQIAYAPDGKHLASRGAGGPIKIWDNAHKLVRTIDCQADRFAFSPDSKRIITGGGNYRTPDAPGELIVWDAETGKALKRLEGHSKYVLSVAWSPDGARIISVSGNPLAAPPEPGEIVFWNATTYEETLRKQPPIGCVGHVQFSPNGKFLAVGTQSGGLHMFDPTSGAALRKFVGHDRAVTCLAFSRDGKQLASGDFAGTAMIWNMDTGERILSVGASTVQLSCLAFDPDGTRLVSAGYDVQNHGRGDIRLWDLTTAQEILALPGQMAAAFSPDGGHLAGAAEGNLTQPGDIRIWDASPTPELAAWLNGGVAQFGAAFAPSGREIAVACTTTSTHNGTVTRYDLTTKKLIGSLPAQETTILHLAYHPKNDRLLATAHQDGTAKLWNLETDREICSFLGHGLWIARILFSPDGETIVTASRDKTIKTWDPANGSLRHSWEAHDGKIFDIQFSPDGALLASAGGDKLVKLWDFGTRQPIRVFQGHELPPLCLAFQPSGALLAAGDGDKTIVLWDLDREQPWAKLLGHVGPVRSVVFSADGRYLFSGGDDQTVKVWDVGRKKEIATFHGHHDIVRSLAIHPNGQWLASASYDRTLKLWNIPDMTANQPANAGAEK